MLTSRWPASSLQARERQRRGPGHAAASPLLHTRLRAPGHTDWLGQAAQQLRGVKGGAWRQGRLRFGFGLDWRVCGNAPGLRLCSRETRDQKAQSWLWKLHGLPVADSTLPGPGRLPHPPIQLVPGACRTSSFLFTFLPFSFLPFFFSFFPDLRFARAFSPNTQGLLRTDRDRGWGVKHKGESLQTVSAS